MKDLRAVLAQFAADTPKLGGKRVAELGDQNATGLASELRNSLQEVSGRNRTYFWICIVMILILFIAACWISLTHLQDPSYVRNVFAVTGVSFLGLISQMTRLWKTKVLSDMTLVLAGGLNPDDLRPIIKLLLTSIKA
jgi:hypothetical protein